MGSAGKRAPSFQRNPPSVSHFLRAASVVEARPRHEAGRRQGTSPESEFQPPDIDRRFGKTIDLRIVMEGLRL
jgi:hypothetical protein